MGPENVVVASANSDLNPQGDVGSADVVMTSVRIHIEELEFFF